jgi:hypothetical protein
MCPIPTEALRIKHLVMCQWLVPAILSTWEAPIRKFAVPGQPRQIVHETPSSKEPLQNGLEAWLKQ